MSTYIPLSNNVDVVALRMVPLTAHAIEVSYLLKTHVGGSEILRDKAIIAINANTDEFSIKATLRAYVTNQQYVVFKVKGTQRQWVRCLKVLASKYAIG